MKVWGPSGKTLFLGGLAQLVRALALQARCRRFESDILHIDAHFVESGDTYDLGLYVGKKVGVQTPLVVILIFFI